MAFSQRIRKPSASTVGASLDMIEQLVHDKLLDAKAAQVQRAALGDFGGEPMPGELSIKDLAELTKSLSAAVLTRGRHEKQQKETRDRIKGEEDPRVRGARLVRKVRQVLGIPVNDTDEPEQEYEDPFADVMREEGLLPPKEEDSDLEPDAALTQDGLASDDQRDERNFRMRLVSEEEQNPEVEARDAGSEGCATPAPEVAGIPSSEPAQATPEEMHDTLQCVH